MDKRTPLPHKIGIRSAARRDLDTLYQIYLEGALDERRLQYPKKTLQQLRRELRREQERMRRTFRAELAQKRCFWPVALVGNTIAGFGQAFVHGGRGRIGRVYIRRAFRRRGIATALLTQLLSELKRRRVKDVRSSVMSRNSPSLRLHRKFGFRIERYKLVKDL